MANSHIENVGRRAHIQGSADIRLPLETPAEKVTQAVDIIRGILESHEGMVPECPPRVYLSEFGPTSMNVRMRYWYQPPDYWAFKALSHKLNLRIKRELETAGIELAVLDMTKLARRRTTADSTTAAGDPTETTVGDDR